MYLFRIASGKTKRLQSTRRRLSANSVIVSCQNEIWWHCVMPFDTCRSKSIHSREEHCRSATYYWLLPMSVTISNFASGINIACCVLVCVWKERLLVNILCLIVIAEVKCLRRHAHVITVDDNDGIRRCELEHDMHRDVVQFLPSLFQFAVLWQ